MPIRFSPDGKLDISTDPGDLPESNGGKMVSSGAMTRCKNLRLDQMGVARERFGSVKGGTLFASAVDFLVEQSSAVRYEFAGKKVYRNGTLVATGNADKWSAISYNIYTAAADAVFACNGTDRKKYEGTSEYEWGITPPTDTLKTGPDYAYTHDWEKTDAYISGTGAKVTRTQTYEDSADNTVYQWEAFHNWETYTKIHQSTAPSADSHGTKCCAWFEAWDDDEDSTGTTGDGVRITYCRYVDSVLTTESNAGDPIYFKTGFTAPIVWDGTPDDSQVTHVHAYRSITGTYYYHSSTAVATATETLYKNLTSTGTELETDHDRPPSGISIVFGPAFDGTCFGVVNNKLHYCKPKQPEYWPADYYVEVSTPGNDINDAFFHGGIPYCLTRDEIYQIQGTGAGVFMPLKMTAVTGTVGRHSAASVKGQGIYHYASDGMYLFNGAVDTKVFDEFEPIFRQETVGNIPGVSLAKAGRAWVAQHKNRLLFAYVGVNSVGIGAYPDNMIVLDLETGRAVHADYAGTEFVGGRWLRLHDQFFCGDSDGYVWAIEEERRSNDNGAAISWEIRSKEFNYLRRFFPRDARWDVTPSGTATGTIYLDGVAHQTHTIAARTTKKRKVATGNGERLSVGVSGTGPVSIHSAEVE